MVRGATSGSREEDLRSADARVLAQSSIGENDLGILLAAARRDPERVLAQLDKLKFARPNMEYSARYSIGAALLAQNKPDAALDAISKVKNGPMQLQAYLYLFASEPAKSKYPNAHRAALTKARAILDSKMASAQRPYQLCELGAQLYDVGDQPGVPEGVPGMRGAARKNAGR